uniref:CCHC-type domain-containing protein n=1 Tax=Chenopodium quinoa TaxID=63459 RepID=A0A803L6I8_CHEQI
MIVVTPEQAALAKKVCFKCQGMGHIARDCGNKVTVSKKEHRMLLAYLDQEEKEKESTCLLNTEEEFDFEEFEGQEKITPEPEHHHIDRQPLTVAPITAVASPAAAGPDRHSVHRRFVAYSLLSQRHRLHSPLVVCPQPPPQCRQPPVHQTTTR